MKQSQARSINTARRLPDAPAGEARASRPFRAEVLDVLDDDTVLVRASKLVRAEIAVIGYVPKAGDHVIVQEGEDGCYVLGALGAARRRAPDARELAGGALIATFPEEGGVELRARDGDLTLSAQGRVVLRAGGDVQIEAAGAADLRATQVTTTAGEIVSHAGRMEVHAERLVEVAGDAYCKVEGLAELQAGRARTLVEGAYQLVARRTTIASDEDTIVDGKRVLLG